MVDGFYSTFTTVNYQVALAILDAINSYLAECRESEVSPEDLDWLAE